MVYMGYEVSTCSWALPKRSSLCGLGCSPRWSSTSASWKVVSRCVYTPKSILCWKEPKTIEKHRKTFQDISRYLMMGTNGKCQALSGIVRHCQVVELPLFQQPHRLDLNSKRLPWGNYKNKTADRTKTDRNQTRNVKDIKQHKACKHRAYRDGFKLQLDQLYITSLISMRM